MLTHTDIEGMVAKVESALADKDDATRVSLHNSAALTFEEWFKFQDLQAAAHASRFLSSPAALLVYTALGESHDIDGNGGWSANATLPVKLVLTHIFAQLLALRIEGKL